MSSKEKKLIPLAKAPLSEITISNVEPPKVVFVQSARKAPRYNPDGEAINGSCSKIICQVVDFSIVKALEKIGAESSSLKTTVLEFHGTEQELLDISIEDDLINSEISTENSVIMLRWEQGRNGSNGAWRGLKIVINLDHEEGADK